MTDEATEGVTEADADTRGEVGPSVKDDVVADDDNNAVVVVVVAVATAAVFVLFFTSELAVFELVCDHPDDVDDAADCLADCPSGGAVDFRGDDGVDASAPTTAPAIAAPAKKAFDESGGGAVGADDVTAADTGGIDDCGAFLNGDDVEPGVVGAPEDGRSDVFGCVEAPVVEVVAIGDFFAKIEDDGAGSILADGVVVGIAEAVVVFLANMDDDGAGSDTAAAVAAAAVFLANIDDDGAGSTLKGWEGAEELLAAFFAATVVATAAAGPLNAVSFFFIILFVVAAAGDGVTLLRRFGSGFSGDAFGLLLLLLLNDDDGGVAAT